MGVKKFLVKGAVAWLILDQVGEGVAGPTRIRRVQRKGTVWG